MATPLSLDGKGKPHRSNWMIRESTNVAPVPRPDLNQAPKSPTGMLETDGGIASRCETDCSFAYLQQGESSAWEDRWEQFFFFVVSDDDFLKNSEL